MKRTHLPRLPWILLLLASSVSAAEVHVSPAGDDANSGTPDRPLRTFAAAQQAARKMKARTVLFHAGTYYLSETIVITPEDSGTTYAAAPGETVVLSGGSRLDLEWKPVLRNNRWRCDHGWDVDLDDGSTNYEIYNNLFLSGGLKLREGFHRRVWNNITVGNSLHPHVWYDNSGDVVTKNIFMGAYRPAGGMPKGKWGKLVDYNLFTTTDADRARFAAHGCDAHSLVGDPLFVDPAGGDYRVKDGSPALKLGFKSFPMDEFGVQKPELKKIARTPELPGAAANSAPSHGVWARTISHFWQGARVKDLTGEEYSAFGVIGGAYKADLGAAIELAEINAWSYHQNGNRGAQRYVLFGSHAAADPGWNVEDRTKFVPIAEVDARSVAVRRFLATGIRRSGGRPLGAFRWLVWVVYPVTDIDENTAYQEFQIKPARDSLRQETENK